MAYIELFRGYIVLEVGCRVWSYNACRIPMNNQFRALG